MYASFNFFLFMGVHSSAAVLGLSVKTEFCTFAHTVKRYLQTFKETSTVNKVAKINYTL